jgi:DNA polymerase-3 subunit alpha
VTQFKQYIDTHIHSSYSLLDGVSSPSENVKRAVELGMPAVAISDHGTVAGIFELYTAAEKAKIKPLLGNELYFKEKLQDGNKDRKYFHGIFLAQNEQGFKNLLHLSSVGYREDHFEFWRPVVSIDEIAAHSEGLVYTTGCMIGVLGTAQKSQLTLEEADPLVARMREIFKDRMFIEIGPAQVCMEWEKVEPESKEYEFKERPAKQIDVGPFQAWSNCLQLEHNFRAMHFAKKYSIPLIIASDAHMAHPNLKMVQDMLITSSPGNRNGFHFHQVHAMLSSEDTWKELQKNHSYVELKSYEEMIDNTYQVLDFCKDFKLSFAPMVPTFPLEKHPLYQPGMSHRQLMMAIIKATGRMKKDPIYLNRLRDEIRVICENGVTDYTNYFLILADITRAARERGVGVGPARGSAGGCLLSYVLGITELDPIKWNLSFSRFLNEGRLGVPRVSFPEFSLKDWESSVGIK